MHVWGGGMSEVSGLVVGTWGLLKEMVKGLGFRV